MSSARRGGGSSRPLLAAAFAVTASLIANCGGDSNESEDHGPCNLACSNHGDCEWTDGVKTCVCDPGYAGDRCGDCAEGYERDADGDCVEGGGAGVELQGSLQKGPFLAGSNVQVALLDNSGNPTGLVLNTTTSNDLGHFDVLIPAGDGDDGDDDDDGATGGTCAEIIGEGFYYNEMTGDLSAAPITMHALVDVVASGTQTANLNVLTHMAHRRVKFLLSGESDLDDAIAQAEGELRAALGLAHPDDDHAVEATRMSILEGDSVDNRYLFALSCILMEAAVQEGGEVDANLQGLINKIGLDLETDGTLDASVVAQLSDAEQTLDPAQCASSLAAWLDENGSSEEAPDLMQLIDTDQDGEPNATDDDDDDDGVADAEDCAPFDPLHGDPDTDSENCGECGNVCEGPDASCTDGVCVGPGGCPGDLTNCGGVCVDTLSDPMNCGLCGVVCSGGSVCADGVCTCSGGQLLCDGQCVDTANDAMNCGGCGNACTAGQSCDAGFCTCPGDQELCDGQCVDTSTSVLHCGACGNACTGGEACLSGACVGGGTGGAAGSGGAGGTGGADVGLCGNGVIDANETCDPPTSCPENCDDGNACTVDQLTGSAQNCNVACSHTAISTCTSGDGCCPAGCDSTTDTDCSVS